MAELTCRALLALCRQLVASRRAWVSQKNLPHARELAVHCANVPNGTQRVCDRKCGHERCSHAPHVEPNAYIPAAKPQPIFQKANIGMPDKHPVLQQDELQTLVRASIMQP